MQRLFYFVCYADFQGREIEALIQLIGFEFLWFGQVLIVWNLVVQCVWIDEDLLEVLWGHT
jgi:hypothetical protein